MRRFPEREYVPVVAEVSALNIAVARDFQFVLLAHEGSLDDELAVDVV